MKKITIISSSVRDGRLSHRVALFLENYFNSMEGVSATVEDLRQYDFPLFHERLQYMPDATEPVRRFAAAITGADGVAIVSPVYNGSFPAALKNVIDLLLGEWHHKPVMIASVTWVATPGIATIQQLQNILLKMGARVTPGLYTVLNAGDDFAEDGTPADRARAEKYAAPAAAELLWMVEKNMERGGK